MPVSSPPSIVHFVLPVVVVVRYADADALVQSHVTAVEAAYRALLDRLVGQAQDAADFFEEVASSCLSLVTDVLEGSRFVHESPRCCAFFGNVG
jgi:hypothetical protein